MPSLAGVEAKERNLAAQRWQGIERPYSAKGSMYERMS